MTESEDDKRLAFSAAELKTQIRKQAEFFYNFILRCIDIILLFPGVIRAILISSKAKNT